MSGLFFDLEDGGDMVLRNVALLSTDYTALYTRGQNSSAARPVNMKRVARIELAQFYVQWPTSVLVSGFFRLIGSSY
jgi:hypothetical protein